MDKKEKEGWVLTKKELPPPRVLVLGWWKDSVYEGYVLAQWIDCKPWEYWIVNGISGGIGTCLQVRGPKYWRFLPEGPKK